MKLNKLSNWRFGVVGNIVGHHIDENGIERYGKRNSFGRSNIRKVSM